MKQKPMEIINVRTVQPGDFSADDIDAFVRLVNREETKKREVPVWEHEIQHRIDVIRYWIRTALLSVAIFTILGFSLIGMIATIAHFVSG